METRANYFLVGLFVVVLSLGLLGFVIWLAKFQLDTSVAHYDVVYQGSVTGLKQGSAVRFSGVKVGEVTNEIEDLAGNVKSAGRATPTLDASSLEVGGKGLEVVVEVPMYRSDAIVRHADALQGMPQAGDDNLRVAAATAAALGFEDGAAVVLTGAKGAQTHARLVIDEGVPEGACVLAAARGALAELAIHGAALELARASGDAAA